MRQRQAPPTPRQPRSPARRFRRLLRERRAPPHPPRPLHRRGIVKGSSRALTEEREACSFYVFSSAVPPGKDLRVYCVDFTTCGRFIQDVRSLYLYFSLQHKILCSTKRFTGLVRAFSDKRTHCSGPSQNPVTPNAADGIPCPGGPSRGSEVPPASHSLPLGSNPSDLNSKPGRPIWGARVLVRLTGFEPTTSRVGVWHSIQLSYSRIFTERRVFAIMLSSKRQSIIAEEFENVNSGFHFSPFVLRWIHSVEQRWYYEKQVFDK